MASLFVENFEGGSAGATVTASNTAFTAVSGGAALTFSATPTPVPQGALVMQTAPAAGTNAYATSTFPSTGLIFRRFYINPQAALTGALNLLAAVGSSAIRAQLHLNTDGTVSLRNGTATVWTSTTVLPANQWSRIEVRVDNTAGQLQARLYVSATNPHTTTITEDSGNRTYNQGVLDTWRLGQLGSATTAATTIYFDAVADDDATWVGPLGAAAAAISATRSITATLTGTVTAPTASITGTVTVTTNLAGTVEAVIPLLPRPPAPFHTWVMFSRDTGYANDEPLPVIAATVNRKHLGVDKAVIDTPLTPARLASLQPGRGVTVYRDGLVEFTGLVVDLNPVYGANDGSDVIHVQCVGDGQHFADRPVFPDPLRAADDQTVNDYWTYTGVASTGMQRLISDQAGTTCRADRRVSGLTLGADPGMGLTRTWKGLFNTVLDQLTVMSVASGANLGFRITPTAGQLTVDIVAPRDLSDSIIFSTDLTNLAGVDYRVAAPTVTHALAMGAGVLHARARKLAVTTDPSALQWGRQVWSVLDQRDTTASADLLKADTDALAAGGPTVSLAVTLLNSDATQYRTDWDLGDLVTVNVGRPGQATAATVTDVIREIELKVDSTGAESIRPAIGSYDATAQIPTPTQKQLYAVGRSLAGLIART